MLANGMSNFSIGSTPITSPVLLRVIRMLYVVGTTTFSTEYLTYLTAPGQFLSSQVSRWLLFASNYWQLLITRVSLYFSMLLSLSFSLPYSICYSAASRGVCSSHTNYKRVCACIWRSGTSLLFCGCTQSDRCSDNAYTPLIHTKYMLSGVDLVFYFDKKLLHAYSSKNVNSNIHDLALPRILEIQKIRIISVFIGTCDFTLHIALMSS